MRYAPKSTPQISGLSIEAVWRELQEIRATLDTMQVEYVEYQIHSSEPAKIKEGRCYYADGVSWNPGYGKGLYIYIDGLWHPLVTTIGHIRPPSAALRLVSFAPLVTRDKVEPVPSASLTLTGYAPLVHRNTTYFIPSAAMALTGIAPTITVTP